MAGNDEVPSTDPALLGILALLAVERAERDPPAEPPVELLLDAAGLDYRLIARAIGKNPDAVRMKIRRAKAAAKRSKR